MRYQETNEKSGFYSNEITAFHHDDLGFMWIGSNDGLYRYDGIELELIIPLDQGNITYITQDESNVMWISFGGQGGTLIKFNPESLESKIIQPGQFKGINYILPENDSILWLGTGWGLVRFNKEKEMVSGHFNADPKNVYFPEEWDEHVTEKYKQDGLKVYDIQPDPSGKGYWIGTDWGLYFVNPISEKYEAYFPEDFPGVTQLIVNDLFCLIEEDPNGRWWISLSRWLYEFDPEARTFYPVSQMIPDFPDDDYIIRLRPEIDPLDKNKIWVDVYNKGTLIIDKDKMTSQWIINRDDPDLDLIDISITSQVRAIKFDNAGNYWIGTNADGFIVINSQVNKFNCIEELSTKSFFDSLGYFMRSIDITDDDKLWMGGGYFLRMFDPATRNLSAEKFSWPTQCFVNELAVDGIHYLKVDPSGNVWTTNNNSCVKRWNPNTNKSSIYQLFKDQSMVQALLWDSLGFAWIGNVHGEIYRLDPESGESFKLSERTIEENYGMVYGLQNIEGDLFFKDLYGLKVLEILEDSDVLDLHIEDYQFKDYIPRELYEDQIGPDKARFTWADAACLDNEGNVWLGTDKNGIMFFNAGNNKVRFYTTDDGLLNNKVNTIISDNKGRIWIGCDYGLSCLNPITEEIISFVENDGLISAKFYHYMALNNGSVKDSKGNLYIYTSRGVIYFNPNEILENVIQHPKVILSSLYINNQIVKPSKNKGPIRSNISYLPDIQLKHTDKMVSFQFTVPEFTDRAKRLHYQHKLEGFDNDWIDANTRTYITYSNIPSGKYKLKINASITNNFYDEDAISLNIHMAPPPWATWWAYTLYVLFAFGAIWGFIAWRTHEQKRKLREVEKVNKRLKQVDQLKDQFLANTSHELRTPLQGIIGLTEGLKDGIAGTLPPKAIENLNMINSSGKRLANLVNDILDFSKLKKHDLYLQLKPVDLRIIVDVVFSVLQPLIKTKDLELSYDIADDTPLVLADENRLQQILYNLLGNSIKFTEKGSVRLSVGVEGKMVIIHISDSGIGIPRDKRKNIFKSFEQAEGGISREYGGTGLGLSVTKQLVKLHGGKIKVESVPGKGSIFSFSLPLSDVKEKGDVEVIKKHIGNAEIINETEFEEEMIEKNASYMENTGREELTPSPLNGRVDILVVDDEPVILQVLKNHLTLEGYNVTLANNGMEAIDLIEKGNRYDLIILDIMMPKLSGYEVCQKLRELFLPSELPVVMLTAKNQVIDLVDGFKTGANDYLTKPFSKDELLSRIKTHLNLQRIHKATGKFVPYEFLRAIGRDSITEVSLGDQVHKEVSILFLDILEYTTLSEKMTPEENFLFINEFVGQLGPVIAENNGFVNQYIGDAIMAIFPENSENGLKAAVEMQQKLDEFNEERVKEGKKEILMGIGLHTGPLIMGIIGDQHHAEPTTIADTVNISSRLEGLTRQYGVRIIVSERSLQEIEEVDKFHIRYLGQALVKGKQKSIKMYECVDGDKEAILKLKADLQKDFDNGLNHFYNKEFPEASVVFNNIIKQNPEDNAAAYFYKRAARFAADGVPEDWTGIEKWDVK